MDVVATASRLSVLDVFSLEAGGVALAQADSARLRAWLDGFDVACAQRLEALTPLAQQQTAGVTRAGRRETERLFQRAETIAAVPQLDDALSSGQISGGHVDVFGHALHKLNETQQQVLAGKADELLAVAVESTPEQFARTLRLEAIRLDESQGVERLERQRRDTALKLWVDPHTGMYRLSGQFDPESGLRLEGRLDNATETLLHTATPDTCPDGAGRQDHLRALALLRLVESGPAEGDIVTAGREVDLCVVVDLDTLRHGLHEQSLLDVGSDAEVPVATIRRMACTAGIIPMVLDGDGVVLDEGRKKRLATRAQRLALRVMYDTCIIPHCPVRSKHCEPHHVDHWTADDGETNLELLRPLCCRHHHAVHEGGWKLDLHDDGSTTITLPDDTTLYCPTPRQRPSRGAA
jgi:Domain of unknown function (DUF222)